MIAIVLALSLDPAIAAPSQCCIDPCTPVYIFYALPQTAFAPPATATPQRSTSRRVADPVLQWNEAALMIMSAAPEFVIQK